MLKLFFCSFLKLIFELTRDPVRSFLVCVCVCIHTQGKFVVFVHEHIKIVLSFIDLCWGSFGF